MTLPTFLFMPLASGPIQEEFGCRGYALDRLQATRGALGGSVLAAILFHATSNLSAWPFPYWHTDLGRYVGFGLALVAAAAIVLLEGAARLSRPGVSTRT